MLFERSPFIHENSKIMFNGILREDPKFPESGFSEEAIDFIESLLQKTPYNRLGFENEQEIFEHPWFSDIDFAVLLSKKVSQ